jgi:7-cyano-7-deazaguanine reductase
MSEIKYGEQEIRDFDLDKHFEIWPNQHKKNYNIHIELPEFTCLCPRSGYPDFATITIDYTPDEFVVELKAIKLYINTFRTRSISHEDAANEIYDLLVEKLSPKKIKLTADFYPRGNVHTVITIDSEDQ